MPLAPASGFDSSSTTDSSTGRPAIPPAASLVDGELHAIADLHTPRCERSGE